MGLGNPLEVVVHYLLIGGTSSPWPSGWSPRVSALVCMVTHWIGLIISHDLRLSSSYDFTKLLHYVVSQPWENTEFVVKLTMTLTYEWNHKLIIYSLWIGSLLMEIVSNRYMFLIKATWYLMGLRQSVWLELKHVLQYDKEYEKEWYRLENTKR